MIKLTTNVIGTFALKNGRIIEQIMFPEDPKEVALRLEMIEASVCDEEIELINKLIKSKIKEVFVNNPERFWGHEFGLKFFADKTIQDPYEIAETLGIPKKDIDRMISDANIELTKIKLRVVEKDKIIMQAVAAIDDIDEVVNRLVERLREWHSINLPELDHMVTNHKLYAELIKKVGGKEEFKHVDTFKAGLETSFMHSLKDAAESSFGAEFTENDIEIIKTFASPVIDLYDEKERIEKYIEGMMKEVAPNITELAGALLGARLIALSGSLERMSTLPASTVQILGAEDAFFKFLRTGKKPPKHGIIFQLPEIRGAPKTTRGKLARTFAAKLSIAAKIDANHGEFIGDKLKKDFMKRFDTLNKMIEGNFKHKDYRD